MMVEEERCEVGNGQMFAVMILVILGWSTFCACALYWLMSYVRDGENVKARAWERALYAQNEAWTRMTQERKAWNEDRKMWRDQIATMQQWLVNVVRNSQPRTDEEKSWMKAAHMEVAHLLDDVRRSLGMIPSADRAADTQRSPPAG